MVFVRYFKEKGLRDLRIYFVEICWIKKFFFMLYCFYVIYLLEELVDLGILCFLFIVYRRFFSFENRVIIIYWDEVIL